MTDDEHIEKLEKKVEELHGKLLVMEIQRAGVLAYLKDTQAEGTTPTAVAVRARLGV